MTVACCGHIMFCDVFCWVLLLDKLDLDLQSCNLLNDYSNLFNDCYKNGCKIESGHVMTQLKIPTTYNQNSGLNCGHTSRVLPVV